MPTPCPVCESNLINTIESPHGRDVSTFSCPLCGDFTLSRTLIVTLPHILERDPDARTKISHSLRTMQSNNKGAELYASTIDAILKQPLPRPSEQADLFIRWLAENISGPGETIWVQPSTHRSIIGAKSPNGFAMILDHLFGSGLITGQQSATLSEPGRAHATLSFHGWEYYEKLRSGSTSYRKAFMAMKFGDPELDNLVESVLKPSCLKTGFELLRLDDNPRAGLIDDRLRVEIQASDFMVADLTHDNLGAYWEAGYAEGLGKPVIYICEKEKFENQKTHFDTNHHLTVIWNKKEPQKAGDDLKATIRATFPQLAKQEDPN